MAPQKQSYCLSPSIQKSDPNAITSDFKAICKVWSLIPLIQTAHQPKAFVFDNQTTSETQQSIIISITPLDTARHSI